MSWVLDLVLYVCTYVQVHKREISTVVVLRSLLIKRINFGLVIDNVTESLELLSLFEVSCYHRQNCCLETSLPITIHTYEVRIHTLSTTYKAGDDRLLVEQCCLIFDV